MSVGMLDIHGEKYWFLLLGCSKFHLLSSDQCSFCLGGNIFVSSVLHEQNALID